MLSWRAFWLLTTCSGSPSRAISSVFSCVCARACSSPLLLGIVHRVAVRAVRLLPWLFSTHSPGGPRLQIGSAVVFPPGMGVPFPFKFPVRQTHVKQGIFACISGQLALKEMNRGAHLFQDDVHAVFLAPVCSSRTTHQRVPNVYPYMGGVSA